MFEIIYKISMIGAATVGGILVFMQWVDNIRSININCGDDNADEI